MLLRNCSTCQLTRKPKPAPLLPIPAISQPFEYLIIDGEGPLPLRSLVVGRYGDELVGMGMSWSVW